MGGVARSRLARLHPDGTLDLDFDPNVSSTVYCLAIQADERILVGGSFSTVGGTTRNYVARIDSNGGLDAGFNPDPDSQVLSMAIQNDGKILMGGYFSRMAGVDRFCVARVNGNGSLDGSFTSLIAKWENVYAIALQPDGKVLVGGSFDFLSSPVRSNLVRLQSDGSLDVGFDPGAIGVVRSMVLHSDGAILMGGDFTSVGGVVRNRVARLGGDGVLDPSWNPGANSPVYSVGLTAQGDILLGGSFTNVGGWPRSRAARVVSDLATTNNLIATGSGQIDWLRGGGVPEVERVSIDLWDGSQWGSLGSAVRVAGGWRMVGLSLPSNGWLRARGRTRSGTYSGSSGWVSTIAGFGNGNVPDITVENQTGTALEYGFALHDFGSQDWLTTGPTTSFTIRNDGTADLTGLSLNVDGADFSIGAPGASTLAPGASVTFTASFTPQAAGHRVGTVRIESNDFDEAVFEVRLVGTGIQALPGFEGTISGTVYTAIALENGNVLVAGDFIKVGGESRQRVARFLSDSSLDPTFSPNVNGRIHALAEQADGKILIAGDFSQVNGITRNRIARLDVDGAVDDGFDPNANSSVYAMALQADGRILIAGGFSTVGGVANPRLARLEVNGSVDTAFAPSPNGYVYSLAIQADGKILAGGQFGSIGGQMRNRIARLETDGTADVFNPDASSYVYCLAIQSDGSIVLGGDFMMVGGIPRERIARVFADGTLDNTFDPGANGRVNSLAAQSDGSVVVGGQFLRLGGEDMSRIGRLLANGTPDPVFQPNANGTVHGVSLRTDGSVLVAGSFSKIGGVDRSQLALLGNDVIPVNNLTIAGTSQIDWIRGGSSPVLASVVMESWDGAGWVSHPVSKVAGGWQAGGLSLPSSAWVRGSGRAQGGYYNGSSSVVRQIAAYGTAWPDIAVEDGAGRCAVGALELDFGTQDYQVPTAPVSLTIRNDGTADLSGLVVESSIGDFVVGLPAVTVLAPGASTTFTVSFSPRFGGVRKGVLSILSNDADETPFLISLTGQGSNNPVIYGSEPLVTLSDPSAAGTTGNRFGEAVAISDDVVVAGAPADDTGGSDAGLAHVFDTGSTTPGMPVFTLAAPVQGVGNLFGGAVAVSGNWIAIGERRNDNGATNSGAVHVFDRSSGTPETPVFTLLHPVSQSSQEFGATVVWTAT